MNGFPDGTFRGEAPLTRYQIAVILKRLLERLGLQPEPEPDSEAGAQRTPGPIVGVNETAEESQLQLPESAREQFMSRLQQAGLTREQAELVLKVLQEEYMQTPPQQTETAAGESGSPLPAATRSSPGAPRTDDPGLLGQSGLLVTPTADLPDFGTVSATASTLSGGDSHALGVSVMLQSGTEVTATYTSGDLPDALVVSAKQSVYSSPDGSSRAAVGVLDVTDEIDTTFYIVGSKDVSLSLLGRHWPVTLSAGLGGGALLDGLFLSSFIPLGSRTATMLEWMGLGNDDQINAGLSWAGPSGIRLKGGTVDGDLAASLSLKRRF